VIITIAIIITLVILKLKFVLTPIKDTGIYA